MSEEKEKLPTLVETLVQAQGKASAKEVAEVFAKSLKNFLTKNNCIKTISGTEITNEKTGENNNE